eukprot:jgi/Ulvmu1/1140/UM107_0014.1
MSDTEVLIADQAVRPRRSKLLTVCPYILGNEFCERLAFYGISTNLVIYLESVMKLNAGQSSIQTSLFSGTCYLTPLLGAWLADGYWGRYKTILVFSVIYAGGMALLASSALVPGLSPLGGAVPTVPQLAVLYTALYVVALGTGGIKPNVSAFGADQFDDKSRAERREKQSFFNWFYFSINVGSLIACTVIVWIQGRSWGVGFAIPAVAMLLAVLIFVAGNGRYKHEKPTGSPLERVADITWHACGHSLRRLLCCGTQPQEASTPRSGSADPQAMFAGALAGAQDEVPDALDAAGGQRGYTREQVDEVRMVLRLGPILLLSVAYWTIYQQMASVFVLQGRHMDTIVRLGGSSTFDVPPASMALFDTLSIIILIPIYDGIVHPVMKRLRCDLTMLQRIGWGFLVASAAMVVAGVVEGRRIAALTADPPANIHISTQILQYTLVGTSEVLASIGQIEFFYDQAPDVMRSCCGALSLLTTALGGYLSAFLMAAVTSTTSWLDDLDDPNTARLDLYFYLLAGFMLLATLVFCAVAVSYKYKVVRHRAPLPLIGGQQSHAVMQQPPPSPDGGAMPSSAIDIGGVRPGYGYQFAGTPSSDVGPYGRSVTYMPQTPVMPPNFR